MTDWHGCYGDSWQGVIVPEAFAHPAKFSRGLIRRIYEHLLACGYLAQGDSVIDPFGGIALGGLDAMTLGLHWTGVELEPRFVALGQANIAKWQRDLAMLGDRVGTARLQQGDSRRLAAVVAEGMAAAVSSPPFGEQQSGGGIVAALQGKGDYEITTSRPAANVGYANQVDSPGNLAALRADDAGFSAAVSSPPYADAVNGTGEGPGARHDPVHHNGDNARKISSDNGYGVSDGNIGNDTGETFWSAARLIVEQTYSVLQPGGVAAWVTKGFVRRGRRVPFSDQWEALCVGVGFEPLERIRAMLVADHGAQLDIFGGAHPRRRQRKSFFRLLAEKNGAPPIDHEDVIILRKR